MIQPFLIIVRQPCDDEPAAVHLIVSACNGKQHGQIEIWANTDDLKTAANRLDGFPRDQDDAFLWELGSEDPAVRFGFYFRLRVFQINQRGRCGIELRFNNNESPPDREVTEFSLEALPADLDRFAKLLRMFSQLGHTVLEWTITDGELRAEL